MRIEELEDDDLDIGERASLNYKRRMRIDGKKMAIVGVGARFLFYPTLLYNVVRNKVQPEFHWWDKVDEFLLLGAVPFHKDVLRLKQLGVSGVITMNEPYETLVPTSFYLAHGIENLVLATRDYLFAPSFVDLCKGVDFIHRNASCGKTTYVHCKAGRGRSTTIILCYLVQHRRMDPTSAYSHVRLCRPRVLLASSQWQAVQDFYRRRVLSPEVSRRILCHPFEENTFTIISSADLEGYTNEDMSLMYRVQFAGQAALEGLSCFLRHRRRREVKETCTLAAERPTGGHPCLLSSVAVGL